MDSPAAYAFVVASANFFVPSFVKLSSTTYSLFLVVEFCCTPPWASATSDPSQTMDPSFSSSLIVLLFSLYPPVVLS